MLPAAIIREAQADGVRLTLSPTGTIKANGDGAAVDHWLPTIRKHKAEIVETLQQAANDPASPHWMWLIHFADREPLTSTFSPEATHAEVLAQFPDAVAAEPAVNSTGDALPALTASEETAIRAWLALIEETDTATIAEVIGKCQRDADARDYFTGRAAAELPKPDPYPDDRRTCDQCANLIARRCHAAKRGEIVASRNYEPIRDLPRRCEGYAPVAADADRRPGRERWPELIQKGEE